MARSKYALILLSGVGGICALACSGSGSGGGSGNSRSEGEAKQGPTRLGLVVPKVEQAPSALDPLMDLAKPVDVAKNVPRASQDGHLVPTHAAPAKALLNLYAVTSYDEVWVYSEPNFRSEKLGFLRRGVRLKVTREQGNTGCRKGWFQLPSGGFACASKGLIVHESRPHLDEEAREEAREPQNATWARVTMPKTPMWWRLPSEDEWDAAQRMRGEWGYKQQPMSEERGEKPGIKGKSKPKLNRPVLSAQGPEVDLPLSPSMPWLEPGYFVNLHQRVEHQGRRFWKTAQGALVQESALADYQPKDFQGQVMASGVGLDKVAFVGPYNVLSNRRDSRGNWSRGETLPVGSPVRIYEVADVRKKSWSRISPDQWVPSKALIRPTPAEVPGGLAANERWIDIDLTQQTLVAYEGTKPVYFTMVSSGQSHRQEEGYQTPVGVWRIYSKEKSSNMVDAGSAKEPRFHEDVPWVMYFSGHLALRGSFWHEDFGKSRTAGSLDLGPSDAKWLFAWTRPIVPPNWHGMLQSRYNPGTAVSIRGETPPRRRSPK